MLCLCWQDFTVLLSECISCKVSIIPPHIHAIYNEDVVAIDFMTGDVIEGHLPAKALAMVREWLSIHKESLQEMWTTQEFRKLPPLE